jgi:hypothetical protein
VYPDFICIGAQKAGTTWLYESLSRHPGVWLPKEKELHYFDEKRGVDRRLFDVVRGRGTEGRRWRRQARRRWKGYVNDFPRIDPSQFKWDFRYYLGRPDDEWYASLFRPEPGQVCGEITPDYSILSNEKVEEIAGLMPDVKTILLLRNPIERAWSHANMELVRAGRRSGSNVDRQEFRDHFRSRRSRMFTDYLRMNRVWRRHFPDSQFFVGFLEDVAFHPNRMLDRIHEFIGASEVGEESMAAGRVHSGKHQTIPLWAAKDLAGIYEADLEKMAVRFGWHAQGWMNMADELRAAPDEERELRYPLWESDLSAARRYQGDGEVRLMSRAMASVDGDS